MWFIEFLQNINDEGMLVSDGVWLLFGKNFTYRKCGDIKWVMIKILNYIEGERFPVPKIVAV